MKQKNLSKIAKDLRRDILIASWKAGACHIGSALSCVDILVDLFWNRLKKGDLFIFSKASGACCYYAVLAKKGYFPKSKLAHYLKKYPESSKEVPGVIWSGGSLGHGLPVAVGLALANRKNNVYVLISDAEVQEGTTWESVLFKNHHRLNNLVIIVDKNNYQACGKIKDILDIPWNFVRRMGIFVMETTKGKGVSFCENDNSWHYRNLDLSLLQKAINENL